MLAVCLVVNAVQIRSFCVLTYELVDGDDIGARMSWGYGTAWTVSPATSMGPP